MQLIKNSIQKKFKLIIISQSSSLALTFLENRIPFKVVNTQSKINLFYMV